MATNESLRRVRIVLDGFKTDQGSRRLTAQALDASGKVIQSFPVGEDGIVLFDERIGERAAKLIIGPADAKPETQRLLYSLPASELKKIITEGELAIAGKIWQPWFPIRRCVGGNVQRCFPFLDVIDSLLVNHELAVLPSIRKLTGNRRIVHFPWHRCSPICFGTVEVYRRICCCKPPVVFDPPFDLDDIPIEVNPDFPPIPPEDPIGPIGPRPGPDPAPIELRQLILTGGAVDQRKVQLLRAKAQLPKLAPDLRRDFILRHPLIWCHCGTAQKVAEGFVQDGGSFSICWREPLQILLPHCHEEFAYIVKQSIGGSLVTIYNGVVAGQWFSASDQPTLTSYNWQAVGCRDSNVPGEGAFVVLEDIGSTPSHQLATPNQDSFQSVGIPDYNSGLLNPVANSADAVGQLLNRNLGGNVALQYHFTESMRGAGATYYRIRIARANANGDPTGSWTTLASPTWATWRLNTATPGSIALGPHNVGMETDLSKIPYDTGDPLGANEEWQDGQFHGVIPTADFTEGRYLVMLEVFNGTSARLKPGSAPAGEAGVVAPFTFRRWNVPASTASVPFAALTHMMWWDNRPAVADIVDLRLLNGPPSDDQCQFLSAGASGEVTVGYRAYHPQPGTPSFLHNHSLVITRGLNGPSFPVANTGGLEVGEPPAGVHTSVPKSLGELLLPDHRKCAFAVRLEAHVKTTNGSGTLTQLDRAETAAFAAEITP